MPDVRHIPAALDVHCRNVLSVPTNRGGKLPTITDVLYRAALVAVCRYFFSLGCAASRKIYMSLQAVATNHAIIIRYFERKNAMLKKKLWSLCSLVALVTSTLSLATSACSDTCKNSDVSAELLYKNELTIGLEGT